MQEIGILAADSTDILHDYTYFDLASPTDYDNLLRVMRSAPHPLRGATLSPSAPVTPTPDAIATYYHAEDDLDTDCFGGWMAAMNGRSSITMRPVSYDAERIARVTLVDALRTIRIQRIFPRYSVHAKGSQLRCHRCAMPFT